jgi:hypothetical protein
MLVDVPGPELFGLFAALAVVGLTLFLGAVWFGLFVLAPRIGRALDRADADEEEPGDRPA